MEVPKFDSDNPDKFLDFYENLDNEDSSDDESIEENIRKYAQNYCKQLENQKSWPQGSASGPGPTSAAYSHGDQKKRPERSAAIYNAQEEAVKKKQRLEESERNYHLVKWTNTLVRSDPYESLLHSCLFPFPFPFPFPQPQPTQDKNLINLVGEHNNDWAKVTRAVILYVCTKGRGTGLSPLDKYTAHACQKRWESLTK